MYEKSIKDNCLKLSTYVIYMYIRLHAAHYTSCTIILY